MENDPPPTPPERYVIEAMNAIQPFEGSYEEDDFLEWIDELAFASMAVAATGSIERAIKLDFIEVDTDDDMLDLQAITPASHGGTLDSSSTINDDWLAFVESCAEDESTSLAELRDRANQIEAGTLEADNFYPEQPDDEAPLTDDSPDTSDPA